MIKVLKDKTYIPSAVATFCKLAGNSVEVIGNQTLLINELIQAERYHLRSAFDIVCKEAGVLRFLPISDTECSIELMMFVNADQESEQAEVLLLSFHPGFMSQWAMELLLKEHAFRRDESTERTFEINNLIRDEAANLCNYNSTLGAFQQSLLQTEHALRLLRKVTDTINIPFTACPVPACRFLAHESEREKIFSARQYLDERYDETVSIKELARAVAMNECYLKKGFKTLIGSTIHEYQLTRRVSKAKEFFQEGKSVTDVAAMLGYSSISHFSTAFKKATGIKPCELLR